MKKYLGILGLLAVTIIWGGGFVASDIALETFTPFQIMAIRFFIAAVCMTALGGRHLRTINKDEVKCGFWLGGGIVCRFRTSDYSASIYDSVQECFPYSNQCCIRTFYRTRNLS